MSSRSTTTIATSTPREKQLVAELRARLVASENLSINVERVNSDNFLERYLRETGWNLDKAMKKLNYYSELNEEIGPEFCQPISEYPKEIRDMCKMYWGGWDNEGRPIAIVPDTADIDLRALLNQDDRQIEKLLFTAFMKHHMKMEKLVLERNADYGILIVNMLNINYGQYLHKRSIEYIINVCKAISRHSPGITKKVIAVNAPRIMKPLVKMALALIHYPIEFVIIGLEEEDWQEKLKKHVPQKCLDLQWGGEERINFLDI